MFKVKEDTFLTWFFWILLIIVLIIFLNCLLIIYNISSIAQEVAKCWYKEKYAKLGLEHIIYDLNKKEKK